MTENKKAQETSDTPKAPKPKRKGRPPWRAHPPQIKAKVTAMLLLGTGVNEIARTLKLPQTTVSEYKKQIPQDRFLELRQRKGEQLDELVYDYMVTGLKALQIQTEVMSDKKYLRKQPAAELATAHGVLADKLCRLLEATTKPTEPVVGGEQQQLNP